MTLEVDFDVIEVRPSRAPRVLQILGVPGARDDLAVELYTGALVDPDPGRGESFVDVRSGTGMVSSAGQVAGWPDGPAARIGGWRQLPIDRVMWRGPTPRSSPRTASCGGLGSRVAR
jgi:hypothetical protein